MSRVLKSAANTLVNRTASRKFPRHVFALVGAAILISACGGNSSSDLAIDSSSEGASGGSVVQVQSDDNCLPTATNDCSGGGGSDIVRLFAEGAATVASIAAGESHRYAVPAGSQVVLSSLSGNADLYLYPEQDFANDNIVCAATSPYVDDICSADDVLSTTQYAIVYGREASQYSVSATNDCSVPSQNQWVDRQMRDYYLFYDQVPSLNPSDYDSPEQLIADLRVAEFDPFSSISNAAQLAQLYADGTSFGMGYRLRRDADGLPRIARVYEDSPMGRANVKRSDIIVSVNDIPWNEIDSVVYNSLVGTDDNPLPTHWIFRDSATGETRQVELTQSLYTINTVLHSEVITYPQYSGKIGYLVFEQFLGPSEAELDQVLDGFLQNNVTDLILDLRYNGGGLTRIARKLISQIAGPNTDGELLIEYRNNDKYRALDFERTFEPQSINLDLKRLVVIASGATASSSEIVINSLRPYIEVVVIGSRTAGKPYVSSARNFCGKSINAMSAQGVNASGENVFGGIAADCAASDDLTRDFGVADTGSESVVIEGMVKSAADYLAFGSCQATQVAQATVATRLDQNSAQAAELLDPDQISLPGAVGL